MPHAGRPRRLRAPSAVELSMFAVAIALGVFGCSSKADTLRTARYDPLNLYYDDSLRQHIIDACHQGSGDEVARYERLPACKLAAHEEQLKRSGWTPPGLGATRPSDTAIR